MNTVTNDEFHFSADTQAAEEMLCPPQIATDMEKEFPQAAEPGHPYDEYAGTNTIPKEKNKNRHWRVKHFMLAPIVASVAVVSLIFSAYNYDPLGNGFLSAGGSGGSFYIDHSDTESVDEITTVVVHVTYVPTGEMFTPDSTDDEAHTDARVWVASKGGNPDTMRQVRSETVLTEIKYSDDFIYVGDSDNLSDGYIAQGTITYIYRCDVYYEAYAADIDA